MMKKSRLTKYYVLSDFISASLAWVLFNLLRYREIAVFEGYSLLSDFLTSIPVVAGQALVPFFWLAVYYFSGYYNGPIAKSRMAEIFQTFNSVLFGVLLLFFLVILNDFPGEFGIYYTLFFYLFLFQFFLTYIPRLCITQYGITKIKDRTWSQNVLIIGTGRKALRLSGKLYDLGYTVAGFVRGMHDEEMAIDRNRLIGSMEDLDALVAVKDIHELVVSVESTDSEALLEILYPLYHYRLPVKILADNVNVLSKLKIEAVVGAPMVDLTANNFSFAEENIKHFLDKVVSVSVLVLFSPLFVYLAYRVKKDSKGEVFFRQERIGYLGKPFTIYKFRTMYAGAESGIPRLSEENDERITAFGRFMRKYRLDELPQFWNVLKGDMSLVGPRPERMYFIEQIVRKAPYFYLMHNVRPGITSLGMVKYGYAKNVDEMIERLAYDVLYYENMSLLFDLKILFYTIRTVVTGKGI